MRKQLIDRAEKPAVSDEGIVWLDLDRLARVELTSEDPAFPIESALASKGGAGWRAAGSGEQTIRLRFDAPQRLQRIQLRFEEREQTRHQEFALSWSEGGDAPLRSIVRQQYSFSPAGATVETESYQVDLANVSLVELVIVPDASGGSARASLALLRMA